MSRAFSLSRQLKQRLELLQFVPDDPRTIDIGQQRSQLEFITANIHRMQFATQALIFAKYYSPLVQDALCTALEQASLSSLVAPSMLGIIQDLIESNSNIPVGVILTLISNVIFDCPDFISAFYEVMRSLCLMIFIDVEEATKFLLLAINYARISIDREVEDLTVLFHLELQRLLPEFDVKQRQKMAWFYIYSTRGNQMYGLDVDFLKIALTFCQDQQIELIALQESLDNCYEMVCNLLHSGFESEYFALLHAEAQDIHAMLIGNDAEMMELALKIIMTQQPQLQVEDEHLVWMVMLMLEQSGNDEEFDFMCERLRYLDEIGTFLEGI